MIELLLHNPLLLLFVVIGIGFALEQTKNDLPNVGYTTVYPLATVAKIILAQVLLAMLL